MKGTQLLVIASFCAAGLAPALQAQSSCSLITMNGKYALNGFGHQYTLGLVQEPLMDNGYILADGGGNISGGTVFEGLGSLLGGTQSHTYPRVTGTYAPASGTECKFNLTLNLSPSVQRTYTVDLNELDTTGVAQSGAADDTTAGDDLALSLTKTVDPAGGCMLANLASRRFAGKETGESGGSPLSGVENVLVSNLGVETETEVEAIGGAHQTSTGAGNVVVSADCTATITQTAGGVTTTSHAVLEFLPGVPLAAVGSTISSAVPLPPSLPYPNALVVEHPSSGLGASGNVKAAAAGGRMRDALTSSQRALLTILSSY